MQVATQPVLSAAPSPLRGPARWWAAGVFLVGAVLQLLEFLLEPQVDDPRARIAWWLTHEVQMDWSQACGIMAIPLLLMGAAVMWRLTRDNSRRIAMAALVSLTMAMIGLGLVHGVELAARWAAAGQVLAHLANVVTGLILAWTVLTGYQRSRAATEPSESAP